MVSEARDGFRHIKNRMKVLCLEGKLQAPGAARRLLSKRASQTESYNNQVALVKKKKELRLSMHTMAA